MVMDMAEPVALLVDGDNISGKHAASILGIAAKHGDPSVVRAYLDAKLASDWHASIGYRLVHAGSGKNAADILLALDAMELILSRGMKCFIIATSDGDFTHLAHRLREHGAKVIGIGEVKAPQSFRATCSSFVEIQAPQALKLVPRTPAGVTEMDQKIRAIIAAHSKKGAGMRITDLAPKMHVQHGVRISTFPEKTWRSYLQARPGLFDLDPRGPEAKVRFRPEGFAQVA
ncbi:NYN domain-containing protein [Roseovarius autotrophicus]|uniref:NYN domain-containing protein n=1 Tax=Roseovarius autotrophicus TaxID=2824121 RepID=UPI001FFC2EDE|nr:NYN domain-containing protein [Roseovarius autotrophicus]